MSAGKAAIDWDAIKRGLKVAPDQGAGDAASARLLEDVYRSRAEHLARPESALGKSQGGIRIVVFSVGRERFGIPLADLSEVVPYQGCTPVPGQPAHFLGLAGCQGDILQVTDLGSLLGVLTAPETAPIGLILILRHTEFPTGLRIDVIEGTTSVEMRDATLVGTAGGAGRDRFLAGWSREGLALLNPKAIQAELCPQTEKNS